jgi:hypothetical protein
MLNVMKPLRILAAVVSLAGLQAQTVPTIPEIVSSGGGWASPSRPSGAGPRMRDVLDRTDTIVRGVIGKPLPSYLSADQRQVFTDHPILASMILYEQMTVLSRLPGPPPDVTVTVRGGTVTINGVPFTARYRDQPEMRPGSECVFLLRTEGGKYRVVGDYFGVFAIENGRFMPLYDGPAFAAEYRGASAETAIQAILGIVRGRAK